MVRSSSSASSCAGGSGGVVGGGRNSRTLRNRSSYGVASDL